MSGVPSPFKGGVRAGGQPMAAGMSVMTVTENSCHCKVCFQEELEQQGDSVALDGCSEVNPSPWEKMSFALRFGCVSAFEFVPAQLSEQLILAVNPAVLSCSLAFCLQPYRCAHRTKNKLWSEKGPAGHCSWPTVIKAIMSCGC